MYYTKNEDYHYEHILYTITKYDSFSNPFQLKSSVPTAYPTFSLSFNTFSSSKVPFSTPSKLLRNITNPPNKHASKPFTLKFRTHLSAFPSDTLSAAPITPKLALSPE